jgi:DNA-binding LacI/PurR family transcriptional regulator
MARSPRGQAATIAEVAEWAGVSIATVSRVLNHPDSVAAPTAERVRSAIAELHFAPRTAARNLSSRRTNAIGLILPEIGWDHFFPPLLRGISAATAEHELGLLIYSSPGAQRPSLSATPAFGNHNTDGLLVFPDGMPSAEVLRLHATGFPMLLLYFTLRASPPIPYVAFENKAGSRRMVDHLIEVHGYQRIGFLAGPEGSDDSQWRERGYRESLETHRIPVRPELMAVGGFDPHVAQKAVEQWILDGVAPDAIFAADDESAIGAIQALARAGRRVPEDVAVVGFDDVPAAQYITPPLTTVRAPIEESGYQAAQMLIGLTRHTRTPREVLFPTDMVIRRSCGCP